MNLREISVSYVKGKYQYKKIYSGLQSKNAKIYYAGPIKPIEPVFAQILKIMRSFMHDEDRLSNDSRKRLKSLEKMMKDPQVYFIKDGISHIIVYENVQ